MKNKIFNLRTLEQTLFMSALNRRTFLKASGFSLLPSALPPLPAIANETNDRKAPDEPVIRLWGDGEIFDATTYLNMLDKLNASNPIKADSYGKRGAVADLEKKFEEITGKEKAMFMPTGTMANQLAIAVLSGENTKVFVQETSHVFRDEADAAQSVFNKRLIPLAKGQTYFTSEELKQSVDYHNEGEVFKSGMGAVSIENPVRRAQGRMIPIEELMKISDYCKKNNLRTHLDGARIYMASVWSGVPIKDYAALFDTVYISLYKYLGAAAGAVLCGEKSVIDRMEHLVKIHGGTMFSNWTNAAMALHRLDGIETRLSRAIKSSSEIFASVNKMTGINISALDGGTNIYHLKLGPDIDGNKFTTVLGKEYSIRMIPTSPSNETDITVNESMVYRETSFIINAIREALKASKK